MKKLKRWLAAILVGEFLTLWHKDKSFKKKLQKSNWFLDKVKITFDGLFDFNAWLIQDIQETNLDEVKNKAISWFDTETAALEDKLHTRESEFATRSDKKLPTYLKGLEEQFERYEKKALSWVDKLKDEQDLTKKVEIFKKRIEVARKALEDKTSS